MPLPKHRRSWSILQSREKALPELWNGEVGILCKAGAIDYGISAENRTKFDALGQSRAFQNAIDSDNSAREVQYISAIVISVIGLLLDVCGNHYEALDDLILQVNSPPRSETLSTAKCELGKEGWYEC